MKLLRSTLLETFVTVAECGGFSEAQYALGITQPAISLRIRDLETALGYRLCERGRGGFRLTERGEAACRKARSILRSARDFDAELLELRDAVTGSLRIGVADAVSSLPGLNLVQALQAFLSRPNEVRLEITVASPAELTQQLITGALHAAIAPFRTQSAGLAYEPLCREEHRLYCGRGHPLFPLPPQQVSPQAVAQHPLCQRSYDMLVSPDLGSPDPQAVVANMEAMAMLIETGQYLGPLPLHYAESRVRAGRLRELSHPQLRWHSAFSLATRRSHIRSRAVELFVEDVRAACRHWSGPDTPS
ncbi:LysR family transcriptional regulator [Leisingera aquaemixtae]|uniref:LysR family transcriptional regulator n=1 Tax=Leisingera aquaemixtae TaxID=1396826 RepID=UPI0021A70C4B|nr:LysR family transcriptional regulator [Leisingera aquaemixtae]UWQ47907.1 LysR family transcriptional regulator [Leisingera aquaemixtae]